MDNREMPADGKTPDKGMLERHAKRRALEQRAKAQAQNASSPGDDGSVDADNDTESKRKRDSL